jgi:hypothetical protein
LTTCIFCSCFSQNDEWKSIPYLEIKIIHEWEELIDETSINSSSVDIETKELYGKIVQEVENTFILHYRIATVECQITIFEATGETKNEFKDYSLLYNKKGELIEADEGSYRMFYYYDKKGKVDSTAIKDYVMGGEDGVVSFPVAKELKRWDRVVGETKWTRLIERKLYSALYYKRKKTKYPFLAKIEYSYFRDGLLVGMKSFDKEGKLKFQKKFTYTFYQ